MKSTIDTRECVANKDRKFGADPHYYPARVRMAFTTKRALFTEEQLLTAVARAAANPEDWPPPAPVWRWPQRLWHRIRALFP